MKYDILTNADIGFEFEFYSNLNPRVISQSIGKLIKKKIVVPIDNPDLSTKKGKVEAGFKPTPTVYRLTMDVSGGKKMFELSTGVMVYEESRIVLIRVLDWITKNGWTNEKCSLHVNISFNTFRSTKKVNTSHVIPLKMILIFDENYVYNRFPDRKYNVYARSITDIFPTNEFHTSPDNTSFIVPADKYYGINFDKRRNGYLEFRYIGGKEYEYKARKILELVEYFVLKTYEALDNPTLTVENRAKLKTIMKEFEKLAENFVSPENFLVSYPEINVFVDLVGNIETLKGHWTTIRDQLFAAVVRGNMTKGIFNHDTDISVTQLKNAKIRNANDLAGFEFFNSDLTGSFNDCVFFDCKVKNSRMDGCKLLGQNEVEKSMIQNSRTGEASVLRDCFIDSPNSMIEGIIYGGVINKAFLGKGARVSEETLVV